MGPKRNVQKDDGRDSEEPEVVSEVENFRENLRITVDENTKVKGAFSDLERENKRLDHMLQDTRQEADAEIQTMRRSFMTRQKPWKGSERGSFKLCEMR